MWFFRKNDSECPIEISAQDVKSMIDSKAPLTLVDCRRPDEYALCRIEGGQLVPIDTLPDSASQILPSENLVVYCHKGVRSLRAARWLRKNGHPNAQSMTGGIEAWSLEIDPQVPRY